MASQKTEASQKAGFLATLVALVTIVGGITGFITWYQTEQKDPGSDKQPKTTFGSKPITGPTWGEPAHNGRGPIGVRHK